MPVPRASVTVLLTSSCVGLRPTNVTDGFASVSPPPFIATVAVDPSAAGTVRANAAINTSEAHTLTQVRSQQPTRRLTV